MITTNEASVWRRDFLQYIDTWPDASLLLLFRIYTGNMPLKEAERLEDAHVHELGLLIKSLEGPRGKDQLAVIRDALERLVEDFAL